MDDHASEHDADPRHFWRLIAGLYINCYPRRVLECLDDSPARRQVGSPPSLEAELEAMHRRTCRFAKELPADLHKGFQPWTQRKDVGKELLQECRVWIKGLAKTRDELLERARKATEACRDNPECLLRDAKGTYYRCLEWTLSLAAEGRQVPDVWMYTPEKVLRGVTEGPWRGGDRSFCSEKHMAVELFYETGLYLDRTDLELIGMDPDEVVTSKSCPFARELWVSERGWEGVDWSEAPDLFRRGISDSAVFIAALIRPEPEYLPMYWPPLTSPGDSSTRTAGVVPTISEACDALGIQLLIAECDGHMVREMETLTPWLKAPHVDPGNVLADLRLKRSELSERLDLAFTISDALHAETDVAQGDKTPEQALEKPSNSPNGDNDADRLYTWNTLGELVSIAKTDTEKFKEEYAEDLRHRNPPWVPVVGRRGHERLHCFDDFCRAYAAAGEISAEDLEKMRELAKSFPSEGERD